MGTIMGESIKTCIFKKKQIRGKFGTVQDMKIIQERVSIRPGKVSLPRRSPPEFPGAFKMVDLQSIFSLYDRRYDHLRAARGSQSVEKKTRV